MTKVKLPWASDVDEDHYSRAYDFLSLYWLPAQAAPAVQALRSAEIVEVLPGDLLRVAQLEPLTLEDHGVRHEITKALDRGELVPPLVINLQHGIVIADGYHRTSAAYGLAPFDKMPVKLAPSPKDAFQPGV